MALKKILKAIKNPAKAIDFLKRKVVLRNLDPTTIGMEKARVFFDNWAEANNGLVTAIQPYLSKTDTLFDVGSNAGFFSKGVLDSGYRGKIVLFEPIPNLQSLSVQTLSEHCTEKVFINAALGEAAGTLDIFLPQNSNIGWITAVKEKTSNQKSIKVTAASTLGYINTFRPQFVKIDVEGFELFILRPFLSTINDHYKPGFLVELGWGKTNPHWQQFLVVASSFIEKGYRFSTADKQRQLLSLEYLKTLDHTTDVLLTAD